MPVVFYECGLEHYKVKTCKKKKTLLYTQFFVFILLGRRFENDISYVSL